MWAVLVFRCNSRHCRVQIQDPRPHGIHQAKFQNFLMHQQGLQSAEFGTLGPRQNFKKMKFKL